MAVEAEEVCPAPTEHREQVAPTPIPAPAGVVANGPTPAQRRKLITAGTWLTAWGDQLVKLVAGHDDGNADPAARNVDAHITVRLSDPLALMRRPATKLWWGVTAFTGPIVEW